MTRNLPDLQHPVIKCSKESSISSDNEEEQKHIYEGKQHPTGTQKK